MNCLAKLAWLAENQLLKRYETITATYNFNELDQLAGKIAAKAINNNKFEISNGFYRQRIKPVLPKLAHSQKKWDYRFSPEYGDFQAALEQLAEKMSMFYL